MAYLENRKALFNYETLDTIEAGIELLGFEVKAVRAGMGSLAGSYVVIDHGEAFLVGSNITPYQVGNTPKEYVPTRRRRLLLSREEIIRLTNQTERDGLTIVPLAMYNKDARIKVELAVARGKKKHDKRMAIQTREVNREIARTLKNK